MPNASMNATIVEIAIVPHATTPLNFSFRSLPPMSQLITAPKSGAKMIILKRLFSIIKVLSVQTQCHLDHRFPESTSLEKGPAKFVLCRYRQDKLVCSRPPRRFRGCIYQSLSGSRTSRALQNKKIVDPHGRLKQLGVVDLFELGVYKTYYFARSFRHQNYRFFGGRPTAVIALGSCHISKIRKTLRIIFAMLGEKL